MKPRLLAILAGCDQTDYEAQAVLPALPDLRIRDTGCYQVNLLRLANAQRGVHVDGTTYLRLSIPSVAPPTGTNLFAIFSVESRYIPAAPTVYWERPAATPQPGR